MKPIEDRGHLLQFAKPVALRRYEPNRVPDPGQCVDCLIIINDRKDGTPRGRLAMSNGASWDTVAWLGDIEGQTKPQPVDLTPLVKSALADMLPVSLPAREVKTIEAPALASDAQQKMAMAILEFDRVLATQSAEMVRLQDRVAFLENNALAKAQLVKEQ